MSYKNFYFWHCIMTSLVYWAKNIHSSGAKNCLFMGIKVCLWDKATSNLYSYGSKYDSIKNSNNNQIRYLDKITNILQNFYIFWFKLTVGKKWILTRSKSTKNKKIRIQDYDLFICFNQKPNRFSFEDSSSNRCDFSKDFYAQFKYGKKQDLKELSLT